MNRSRTWWCFVFSELICELNQASEVRVDSSGLRSILIYFAMSSLFVLVDFSTALMKNICHL